MNHKPLLPVYRTVTGLKTPRKSWVGEFHGVGLMPININFQLLILVLANKNEQLNKHLGKHPLASFETHLSPVSVSSPLAADGHCADAMERGWGSLHCNFVCFAVPCFFLRVYPVGCSFLRVCLLCHHLCSHPARTIPLGWLPLPPSLPVGQQCCSVHVILLILLLGFFNQS